MTISYCDSCGEAIPFGEGSRMRMGRRFSKESHEALLCESCSRNIIALSTKALVGA